MRYNWQLKDWPSLTYDAAAIVKELDEASFHLGVLHGELAHLGFDLKAEACSQALSAEIVGSAAIEGETLNREDVRSSVAKRMDLNVAAKSPRPSREIDARVEMMMDATSAWDAPLTRERLFAWHAALFPTGWSGLTRIRVGQFRDDAEGPMRVVSRHGYLERVHFQAPPAERLDREMDAFLTDLNHPDETMPPLVHAALAHYRFVTIHPFDDGNGRLARALTEYLLARMEKSALRFYSLSAQIQKEKDAYYNELQRVQRGGLDVTPWVKWFLALHARAVSSAEELLAKILFKARFWQRHLANDFNEHQKAILNRLLDGFVGNLTSSKWAKMCKVSQDTASREIRALMDQGVLVQEGNGRSTHYRLVSCHL